MAQSFIILGGLATGSEKDVEGARAKMAQNREKLEKYYETKRTYTEAYQEGSSGRFATRTFMEQAPNIALAIGTSGAGLSLGMTEAGVSTLVGTLFGLTSSGQKYDDLTTRQEIAADAQKAKNELEEVKDLMGDREYLEAKYQLERAIKENDISSTDKTLAVLGTGLIEGTITKFFGTVPNSIKVLKDLRAPSTLIDDLMRSNYKAAGQFFKEIGKRTGGEIIEETSIEALTQINDFAFIGDEMDFSQLDDVAVTSIITSGGMNVPSTAYSTLMSQINVNRYKSKIQGITGEIQTMKDLLNDKDLTDIQRTGIHNKINALVGNVADVTTAMEGDALLLGSDNLLNTPQSPPIIVLGLLTSARNNILNILFSEPTISSPKEYIGTWFPPFIVVMWLLFTVLIFGVSCISTYSFSNKPWSAEHTHCKALFPLIFTNLA